MDYRLPEAYITKMKNRLGADFPAFLESYKQPRTYGLRINRLKISAEEHVFQRLCRMFRLTPVPWCRDGFYYDPSTRPGKSPYHFAGLYYIQEPSAMSAVELLDPQPGDAVLDLAAAPGGKATQIASKMHGQGLLVANEIHPPRAKILSENIERMGIPNAVVVCASPQELSQRFRHYFDKIMLDAPCSGEGMFRKDPEAIEEWSPEQVSACSQRQSDILGHASVMLKPGGRLAYSTCTFSEEENERVIHSFLRRFPHFTVETIKRIWPHKHRGEGHFVAVLRNDGESEVRSRTGITKKTSDPEAKRSKFLLQATNRFEALRKEVLPGYRLPEGEPLLFGEQLYWLPKIGHAMFVIGSLQGIKVLRPGLHLATVKKDRAVPAHSLALTLQPYAAGTPSMSFPSESKEVHAFLKGETLQGEISGWCVICVDGFPLGWGKGSGGQIKNHFPKGLRLMGS